MRVLPRDREGIERLLRRRNLRTEALDLTEARPRQCFRSVTQLEPTGQVPLFE